MDQLFSIDKQILFMDTHCDILYISNLIHSFRYYLFQCCRICGTEWLNLMTRWIYWFSTYLPVGMIRAAWSRFPRRYFILSVSTFLDFRMLRISSIQAVYFSLGDIIFRCLPYSNQPRALLISIKWNPNLNFYIDTAM